MQKIKETNQYIIVEFDDDDLNEDKDIQLLNKCTIRGIEWEFINEDETQVKIWRN